VIFHYFGFHPIDYIFKSSGQIFEHPCIETTFIINPVNFNSNNNYPALIISGLSLAFSIVTFVLNFWWLHTRRGKVVATNPLKYGSFFKNGTLKIQLPIVLFNTGAQPNIIRDFRLHFLKIKREPLRLTGIRSYISSKEDDFKPYTAFVLNDRETKELVLQFECTDFENLKKCSSIEVELDALLGKKNKWEKLILLPMPTPDGGFDEFLKIKDFPNNDKTPQNSDETKQ